MQRSISPVRYGNHSPSLGYRCAPKRRLARQQSSARDPQCGKFAHHSLRARQSSPPFSLRRSGSLVPAPSRQCKSLLPPRPDIPPVAHLARILAGCAGPDRREYWSTSIPPHLSGSRPTRWRTPVAPPRLMMSIVSLSRSRICSGNVSGIQSPLNSARRNVG